MSPLYSGLILMTVGAFFAGGGISFRKQGISLGALWIIALALFGYGAYVTFVYGSQG